MIRKQEISLPLNLIVIFFAAFNGTQCELDLTKCDEYFPCFNNGSCTINPNNSTSFMCDCIEGFSGDRCEDDISVCTTRTNPCLNGGKCVDGLGIKFNCQCQPGWTGSTCESNIDDCISQPCLNGGICIDQINNFNCACPFGYDGRTCETRLKICIENPCKNGAFCLEENDKKICYCVPDYHGILCEEQYDECQPEPQCFNGGTCIDGVGGFNCTCATGFFGARCECSDGIREPGCVPEHGFSTILLTTMLSTITPIIPLDSTIRVTATSSPSTSLSQTGDYEVHYEPTPTIFTGENTSTLFVDSSFIDIISLSLSVLSSLGIDSIIASEKQFTDSTGNDVSISLPTGTKDVVSTYIWDSRSTKIPPDWVDPVSYLLGEPPAASHFLTNLSPSYDFESSVWESYETVKVFPPTESGLFQTRVPVQSGLETIQIHESTYVTVIPSSDFFSQSITFPFGSSPSEGSFISEDSKSYESPSSFESLIFAPPLNSSSLISTFQSSLLSESPLILSTSFPFTSVILQTIFQSENQDSDFIPSQFLSEPAVSPVPSYSISWISTLSTEFLSEITSFEDSSMPLSLSVQLVYSPGMSNTYFNSLFFQAGSDYPSETRPILTLDSSFYSNPAESSSESVVIYPSGSGTHLSHSHICSFLTELPSEMVSASFYSVIPTLQIETDLVFTFSTIPLQTKSTILGTSTFPSPETGIISSDSYIFSTEKFSDTFFPFTETQLMPGPGGTESSYYPYSSDEFGDTPVYRNTPTLSIDIAGTTIPSGSLFGTEVLNNLSVSPTPTGFPQSTIPMTSQYLVERETQKLPDWERASTTFPLKTIGFSSPFNLESSTIVSFTDLAPSITRTAELLSTATPTLPSLPVNLTDPCLNYCQNNAKCLSQSIEPPFCLCSFRFTGDRCEFIREKVAVPSFKGNSFLAYKLPIESVRVLDISTTMATLIPDGIIMYSGASKGKIYAFIFVQAGLLTLHFSCGSQSMNFVETRTRVDNGFNFTLHLRMEIVIREKNDVYCIGQLRVNGSYIMSGEQVVVGHQNLFENSSIAVLNEIFIGGIPLQMAKLEIRDGDQLLAFIPGFRGCMYQLSISQEERDMFDDAMDGKDISECGALACLMNPCFGMSDCVPKYGIPAWQCICPSGFEGSRCQIPICRYNPCLNGATCAAIFTKMSNPNITRYVNDTQSESSLCLCKLGFTGPLCQNILTIQKPSFHPTSDYSSYVSYHKIPDLGDWFQLKFNFVTKNMSQLALLMFVGNKRQTGTVGSKNISLKKEEYLSENGSDFFALSFLQGFIALTWDLGTGTQRIITPSRVDPRLGIHTLLVGRRGRVSWIKVDGMRNITGKTVGPLYRLNVNTDLFIGGYDSFQFEGLPHDLPMLHHGFQGCVFDLGFRVQNKLYLPNVTAGRNVKNCFEEDC